MKKFLDYLIGVLECLAAIALALAIVLVVIQIVSRYVFNDPVSWTELGARYLFIWIVMLAIPVSYHRGGAFVFDLLVKKISKKLALVVSTMTNLLCLAFTVYYFWQGLQLCITAGWRVSSGIPIKMGVMYAAQPICAAVLCIVIIGQIVDAFTKKEGSIN